MTITVPPSRGFSFPTRREKPVLVEHIGQQHFWLAGCRFGWTVRRNPRQQCCPDPG